MICSKYYLKLPGKLIDNFKKEVIESGDPKLRILEFKRTPFNNSWDLTVDYADEESCIYYEKIINAYKYAAKLCFGEVA